LGSSSQNILKGRPHLDQRDGAELRIAWKEGRKTPFELTFRKNGREREGREGKGVQREKGPVPFTGYAVKSLLPAYRRASYTCGEKQRRY